jgi:PKD repeat protein/ligand-binding sensor domain-containing protein
MLSDWVKDMTQDSQNNYWFANDGGVTKFDGTTWTTFTATGSIGSLPYGDINCITFDSQDNLWLGTEDHGAMKYNGNIWEVYNTQDAQAHVSSAFALGVDHQGDVYTGDIREYFISPDYAYSKMSNGVWTSSTPETPLGDKIGLRGYDIHFDQMGRQWITSYGKGTAVKANGSWQIFTETNSSYPSNVGRCVAESSDGYVYVPTNSGLVRFDNQLNMTVYDTLDGVSDQLVWDVVTDSSNNIWLATNSGIDYYNGTTWTNYTISDYGSTGTPYRVEIDGDQNVWVSMYGDGLVKYDGSTWTHYTSTNSSLNVDHFYQLMVDKHGTLWAASSNKGVYRNIAGSWIEYIDSLSTKYNGHRVPFINMKEGKNDEIWLTTWNFGLVKLELCNGFNTSVTLLGDSAICAGDSTLIQANNGPHLSYKWYRNGVLLQGESSSLLTIKQNGAYYAEITDTVGGCFETSETINITVNDAQFNLAFSASNTQLMAPPFNVNFTNQTPQITSYSFNWEFGDGNISNYYHPYHQYQYNGSYDVKLIATHNLTGCVDELLKPSYITTSGGTACTLTATISNGSTATICDNDSIMLSANSGAGLSYQWVLNGIIIPNSDTMNFWANQSGHYAVIIDDGNCTDISNLFALNHYPSNQPMVNATGSIMPCTNDSLQLSLSSFYQQYQWSTGDTVPSIWVHQTGYYYADVVDQFGCARTSNQYQLSNSFLTPPNICIVGVDSASSKNRIIWERQQSNLIDSIVVFRETYIAGVYDRIGAMPYSQSGVFVDSVADPSVRAWRYKLAAVDSCGALSLYSPLHKTIHLTINAGLNGSWNLLWDNYVGIPVSSYFIYRGSNPNNMQLLTQIPGNLNSFTDFNPPSGTVHYQIAIVKPDGCYPDSLFSKANTNFNTSRSNVANSSMLIPVYLTADFMADVTQGSWPIQIAFTDLSLGNPQQWYWDFGDGNYSIEQNPSHTYNNVGQYTVKLIVKNSGFEDSIVKSNLIDVTTEMVNIHKEKDAVNIFPNPTKDHFNLHFEHYTMQEVEIKIYAVNGDLVANHQRTISMSSETLLFETGYLSPGVYLVQIVSKFGVEVKRLIIE